MVAEHPWQGLPPEVADVLRPELPALADEIVDELSRGVPDYARPLEGPFGQALRMGVEEALSRFTRFLEDPKADPDADREVYVNLGRGEMRAGRSLDALLAAYRLRGRGGGGGVGGGRGGGGRPPGSGPACHLARSTRSPRRSSRTSTSCRPTRSRATRASRPPRRARCSAGVRGSPRCWCRAT